jgi:hypothetical protein
MWCLWGPLNYPALYTVNDIETVLKKVFVLCKLVRDLVVISSYVLFLFLPLSSNV